MINVSDITQDLKQWAPESLAYKWDSVGLQIGSYDKAVQHVLLSLDLDQLALDYMEKNPVDLLITHHPLFFNPIKAINYATSDGRIIKSCIENDVTVWTAHTNLDAAKGGVTDCLMDQYGIQLPGIQADPGNIFKWVCLDKPIERCAWVEKLGLGRWAGSDTQKEFKKVAFCGGSGKSFIPSCVDLGVDLFITGEVGYHDEVFCALNGITLRLLGHKESEQFILPAIQKRLDEAFGNKLAYNIL